MEDVPWTVNAKLWTQFMIAMSLHEKYSLGRQKENGRKVIITIESHSTTNDNHIRQHFQFMCGI